MLQQRNNFAFSWSVAHGPWSASRTTDNGPRTTDDRRRTTAHGFTLIEVMIAITLSLLLLYGINRVFSTTGEVIGLGNATMEANNQLRSTDTTLRGDFEGAHYDPDAAMNTSSPASTGIYSSGYLPLVITNQEVSAWRNKREEADDGADVLKMPKHRIDTLSFFSRGSFTRQTGDATQFTYNVTAQDAWVWYGHTMQANNADDSTFGTLAAFMQQGTTASDNFYPPSAYRPDGTTRQYAQDWTLGRMAILMYARIPYTVGATTYYPIFPYMPYLNRNHSATPAANDLTPIVYNTYANKYTSPTFVGAYPSAANQWLVQWGLCDLGSVSDSGLGVGEINGTLIDGATSPMWWQNLLYRFNCVPDIVVPSAPGSAKLTMGERMSLANPALIEGCTDFIVEFAGDFQSPVGLDRTPFNPDGTTTGSVQRIQWYGMPRDDDQSVIMPPAGGYAHPSTPNVYGTTVDAFAWGPGISPTPELIRITIKVVDPRDQLQVPMTRQFIFQLR